ncbi:DUF1285 domain-containing protein [Shimia sp. SDUM112013]|uniref:DUF1285 domain-containing protein n=1 Tax=Shimia sp. SDUM112013 TaxID=3136160 RepID=UPI0032EC5D9E
MSGQIPVKPGANDIAASARAATKGTGIPPVHLWNPPFSGNMDLQILRDGRWIHEGGEIRRPELVKLFASILRKDGDAYFLVTPVEKVGIMVEDAPFVAVDVDQDGEGEGQVLTFTTNVGDSVVAGSEAPIRVEFGAEDEPAPYVIVRRNLEARLDRKTFYRMVDFATQRVIEGQDWFGVWSSGTFFKLMPSEDLETLE